MAQGDGEQRRRGGRRQAASGGDGQEKKPRTPTGYVVGELVTADFPSPRDGERMRTQVVFAPVLDDDGKPKRFLALDQAEAIAQHAGTEEGKKLVGRWKAISWSSWKGVVVNPPPAMRPAQESERIEDE